jgi:hypothetical protein
MLAFFAGLPVLCRDILAQMQIDCIRQRPFRTELHNGGDLGAQNVIQFRHVLSKVIDTHLPFPYVYLSNYMVR